MNVNPISQFKFSEYTNGLNFTAKQDAGTPPHAGGTKRQNGHKFNYVSYTGYGALAAGVASGIAARMKKFKAHRYLAYAACILSVAHLGIVETKKHQYRKNMAASQVNNNA